MAPQKQFRWLCTLFTLSIVCAICAKVICKSGSVYSLKNLTEWPLTMWICSIVGLVCYVSMMTIFLGCTWRWREALLKRLEKKKE